MPKMKVAFQAFDADEFKKFGCPTCHGDKAKARKFKMPNADFHELPGNQAGFATLMEKKPKMMKFMAETVKPQMATAAGPARVRSEEARGGRLLLRQLPHVQEGVVTTARDRGDCA